LIHSGLSTHSLGSPSVVDSRIGEIVAGLLLGPSLLGRVAPAASRWIVLNVGLELGVVSPMLFTLLVVMAVVTTIATTPVLDRLRRGAAA
jgi:hypothetical protein